MSERVFNFSAGPAILPEPVLREAQRDIWDIGGTGIGILEHSHRGAVFDAILAQAEADCRRLASIPDEYRVLFLQGGASTQFFMVPANLLPPGGTADYLETGYWAGRAIEEARHYGEVHIAASGRADHFRHIPTPGETQYSRSPAYVHFTSNNTIYGTQFAHEPEPPQGVPLVCDASSDLFSRPIDVRRYGLIYAGAQKNLGPAGATLVIVHQDLLERTARDLPSMLRYQVHAEKGSRYNTPPVFAIYVMHRVFAWLLEQGGLEAMAARNRAKAASIYDVIDETGFYEGTASPESRSLMNITFRLSSPELESRFIAEAAAEGMVGLKGHRAVGGVRASIYNAFPEKGCQALAEFMRDFEARYG